MEKTDNTINDLLDDFDRALFADVNLDIGDLPLEIEKPDRRIMENSAYVN